MNIPQQQPAPGSSKVPIITPTIEVPCWVCDEKMKVPADAPKKFPRLVCGQCGKDFDAFLWSLFKQAVLTKKKIEQAKNN